jgi:uroporphyrinogen decarboxylase
MTSRERLLTVLRGDIPDCVPVAPDFSNMIPAKLTGKPFWELYLYNKIPIWEAYIKCAKHFDIDALMDGYFPLQFPEETVNQPEWDTAIISNSDDKIITQKYYMENNNPVWYNKVDVYFVADPPSMNIDPAKVHLPPTPKKWKPAESINPVDKGPDGFKRVKELLGNQGLIGAFCGSSAALSNEEDIFNYYDHPEKHEEWAEERVINAEKRFERIMAMQVKPDFICVGGSGTLVFQTVEIFRQLAYPATKRIIELATEAGMPTHIHSCGPETALVKIMAEETSLTVIDPLEIPQMGDCDLAKLKKLYGNKLTLKGNLHTTAVMLNGSVEDVIAASKKAIDDAAEGGRFILSTGDQCGRDTPPENLYAMIETARSYGRY